MEKIPSRSFIRGRLSFHQIQLFQQAQCLAAVAWMLRLDEYTDAAATKSRMRAFLLLLVVISTKTQPNTNVL